MLIFNGLHGVIQTLRLRGRVVDWGPLGSCLLVEGHSLGNGDRNWLLLQILPDRLVHDFFALLSHLSQLLLKHFLHLIHLLGQHLLDLGDLRALLRALRVIDLGMLHNYNCLSFRRFLLNLYLLDCLDWLNLWFLFASLK